MNKGQVLFSVFSIAAVVIVNALDMMNALGQAAYILYLVTYPLAILGFILLLVNIATGTGMSFSYPSVPAKSRGSYAPQKKRNPSHIARVLVYRNGNEEHIVNGEPSSTFREVCLIDWPFSSISKSSQWDVVDERGNNISNSTLESYYGIAEIRVRGIVTTRGYHVGEPNGFHDDKSEEYTSIDQGVTYYD